MSKSGRAWREIQEKIRPVLNSVWDPIGVADMVDDEYDWYIGAIYVLIRDGADDRKISDHLLKLETTSMGLRGTSAERRHQVVAALRALELPEFHYPG
jgi:hypothetical protein